MKTSHRWANLRQRAAPSLHTLRTVAAQGSQSARSTAMDVLPITAPTALLAGLLQDMREDRGSAALPQRLLELAQRTGGLTVAATALLAIPAGIRSGLEAARMPQFPIVHENGEPTA